MDLQGPAARFILGLAATLAVAAGVACSPAASDEEGGAAGAAISGPGEEAAAADPNAIKLTFPPGRKLENGVLDADHTTFTFDLEANTAARIVLNGPAAEAVQFSCAGQEGTGSILWFHNETASAKSYEVKLTPGGDKVRWLAAMSLVAPDADLAANTWACAIGAACTYQGFDPQAPETPPRLNGVCKEDTGSVLVSGAAVGRCVAK
jgi:hypothetical protein